MIEKIEGIVVAEKSYGETSKILDIFTKEYGIIGVLSKGCKKMKSPLRSISSKFTYGIFYLYYKENKLSTLTSVDVLHIFKNIKSDISKISYASFLLELASSTFRQNQNNEIYDLLIASLLKIEEGFDPMVITNILELKYLNYLGVMPSVDACVLCGNTKNITTLSSIRGGYICTNCLTTEEIVSSKTIKLIRLFYYVDIAKISKLEIGNKEKMEISRFLDDYYDSYTGLYLKSRNFLRDLNKI